MYRTFVAKDYGIWLLNMKSVSQETLRCKDNINRNTLLSQALRGLLCNKRKSRLTLHDAHFNLLGVFFSWALGREGDSEEGPCWEAIFKFKSQAACLAGGDD